MAGLGMEWDHQSPSGSQRACSTQRVNSIRRVAQPGWRRCAADGLSMHWKILAGVGSLPATGFIAGTVQFSGGAEPELDRPRLGRAHGSLLPGQAGAARPGMAPVPSWAT